MAYRFHKLQVQHYLNFNSLTCNKKAVNDKIDRQKVIFEHFINGKGTS